MEPLPLEELFDNVRVYDWEADEEFQVLINRVRGMARFRKLDAGGRERLTSQVRTRHYSAKFGQEVEDKDYYHWVTGTGATPEATEDTSLADGRCCCSAAAVLGGGFDCAACRALAAEREEAAANPPQVRERRHMFVFPPLSKHYAARILEDLRGAFWHGCWGGRKREREKEGGGEKEMQKGETDRLTCGTVSKAALAHLDKLHPSMLGKLTEFELPDFDMPLAVRLRVRNAFTLLGEAYATELEAAADRPGYADRSKAPADVQRTQSAMIERAMAKAGLRRLSGTPLPLDEAMQRTRDLTAAMTGRHEWRKP